MGLIVPRQITGMLEVACLPTWSTHPSSRRIRTKWQLVRAIAVSVSADGFPAWFCLDEVIKASEVLKFRVGVEQEGGMIHVGEAEETEFLEIYDEVVDTLYVQEL